MTAVNNNNTHNMRTNILRRRYLWKDEQGNIVETEDQMFCRVANTIAASESKYGATKKQVKHYAEKFHQIMSSCRFLPNSPTLMNAGRPKGLLSACFVLPVPDSVQEHSR